MFKTVGASILLEYEGLFVFEIQKRHKWKEDGLEIGIGCIGGGIEKDEEPMDALIREAEEEIGLRPIVKEVKNPFSVSEDGTISDMIGEHEKDLFFDWHGRENRICVFRGEISRDPRPDDLAGIIVSDLETIVKVFELGMTFEKLRDSGAKVISRETIPQRARIFPTATTKIMADLFGTKEQRFLSGLNPDKRI